MANQSSFIKLEGTIGDVTFYKGKNGFHARQKGGIARERILNDEKFRRTRENLAEFSQAATSSKLLKDVFGEITLRVRDARIHNRLYSKVLKVLRTDLVNDRGERLVQNGDFSLLADFQFNYNAMMESTLYGQYEVQSGGSDVELAFQPFIPTKHVLHPKGATHFRLFVVAAGVDFENVTYGSNYVASAEYPINTNTLSGIVLTVPKSTGFGPVQFYGLGIEFLQMVNGKYYDLNNRAHNSAKIILIEQ